MLCLVSQKKVKPKSLNLYLSFFPEPDEEDKSKIIKNTLTSGVLYDCEVQTSITEFTEETRIFENKIKKIVDFLKVHNKSHFHYVRNE